MKQAIETYQSGEVELNVDDQKEAAYYASLKNKARFLEDIKTWLKEIHNYDVNKIARTESSQGLIVKAEIRSKTVTKDIMNALYSPDRMKKAAGAPTGGNKRINVGFIRQLTDYLRDEARQKGKEKIDFDEVFENMHFLFPELTRSKMIVYVGDTRLQKKHGFKYWSDGKNQKKWVALK